MLTQLYTILNGSHLPATHIKMHSDTYTKAYYLHMLNTFCSTAMDIVYVDGVIKHCGKSVKARLLVNSDTTYTVLTENVWKELGLEPLSEMEFGWLMEL